MSLSRLNANLNVIQALQIPSLDEDLNIIQKLDDEPNDVGGLSAAELKAKFDEAGLQIQNYLNETLLPAISDTVVEHEQREEAEAARAAAEQAREAAERERQARETARIAAEQERQTAEQARVTSETNRVTAETARTDAETARAAAETTRVAAEQAREDAGNGILATAQTLAEEARQQAALAEMWATRAEEAKGNLGRVVIRVRVRDPDKPSFGIGEGGEEQEPYRVYLDATEDTGTGKYTVIVNGVSYNARNFRIGGADAPDGSLIANEYQEV